VNRHGAADHATADALCQLRELQRAGPRERPGQRWKDDNETVGTQELPQRHAAAYASWVRSGSSPNRV
jgi:hypothetical protein